MGFDSERLLFWLCVRIWCCLVVHCLNQIQTLEWSRNACRFRYRCLRAFLLRIGILQTTLRLPMHVSAINNFLPSRVGTCLRTCNFPQEVFTPFSSDTAFFCMVCAYLHILHHLCGNGSAYFGPFSLQNGETTNASTPINSANSVLADVEDELSSCRAAGYLLPAGVCQLPRRCRTLLAERPKATPALVERSTHIKFRL